MPVSETNMAFSIKTKLHQVPFVWPSKPPRSSIAGTWLSPGYGNERTPTQTRTICESTAMTNARLATLLSAESLKPLTKPTTPRDQSKKVSSHRSLSANTKHTSKSTIQRTRFFRTTSTIGTCLRDGPTACSRSIRRLLSSTCGRVQRQILHTQICCVDTLPTIKTISALLRHSTRSRRALCRYHWRSGLLTFRAQKPTHPRA